MMRILILIGLLILAGCAGGSSYTQSRDRNYMPQPIYNTTTGEMQWVNELCCPRENRRSTYMDYTTGETYHPVGRRNLYMNSKGKFYQSYERE